MKEFIEQFLIMIQFMTRIPIPIKIEYSEEKLGKGIKLFPLVGVVIGIILFCFGLIFNRYITNKLIVAFLLVVVELLVVGIIHIDGLADTFDGLFSYTEKERMLEIMKDSRVGTNGAVILILYFFAKIILIAEIVNIDTGYLVIYPVISRLSTSINAGFGKYAKQNGMSTGIIGMNTKEDAIFSMLLAFVWTVGIMELKGIIVFFVGLLFIFYFRKIVYRKLDGITGDTLGASLELTSIVVLLTGVILK